LISGGFSHSSSRGSSRGFSIGSNRSGSRGSINSLGGINHGFSRDIIDNIIRGWLSDGSGKDARQARGKGKNETELHFADYFWCFLENEDLGRR
jgi:hypothetical protein